MDYELTAHAREILRKHAKLRLEWLERVMDHPQLIHADQLDPELEHRLGVIAEFDGRDHENHDLGLLGTR